MKALRWLAAVGATLVLAVSAAVVFGGPKQPPTMRSISDPFKGVSFSGVPQISRFTARDGSALAYRRYAPAPGMASQGSVILVHGSSANSRSMHPLAESFTQAGYTVYALDIRGHGGSGSPGLIGYVGELEDDLDDFVRAVKPEAPKTLVGFSSGGGFVLRVAGGPRQTLFDHYLLMSPYLNYAAPTSRGADSAGWASVGVPRTVALGLLNRLGITRFNTLPVVRFAVDHEPSAQLTSWYSYALAASFQPHNDYQADIRAITRPVAVIAGQDDEVFRADRFRQAFDEAGRNDIPVTLIPATGHIALTLSPAARAAAVAAVERLALPASPSGSLKAAP